MKKLLSATFVLISFCMFAQKGEPVYQAPNIPVDNETKLITFTKVVTIAGTKDEIYKKSLNWFNTYYKNPTEIIREKNEAEGTILGKGRFKYNNPPDKKGLQTQAGVMQYTIKVSAKDGKYKYEIKDFNIKDISYKAAEFWLNTTAPTYTNVYAFYLMELDKNINELITNLEESMKKTEAAKSDNW